MKNILFIAVSVSLALLIGCQENMVNEPADTLLKGDPETTAINQPAISKTVKLNYELQDPSYGGCRLTGKYIFSLEVHSGSLGPSRFKRVSVQIHMQSDLNYYTDLPDLEDRIDSKSEDVFYLSEEGSFLLEKTYRVANRKDIVVLLQYNVTEEDISVSRVSLIQIES